MPITIIPRGQPIRIETIVALILGQPGIGKTTLTNTASQGLNLDFDEGSHRSKNRGDVVRISKWSEIADLTAADVKPYRTIVPDTIGKCLDCLIADIIENEPSLANGGTLKIQGYGRLKSRFTNWLKMVRGYGINVVMIGHAVEERHGDNVRLRVDGAGSGKEEVYKCADLMGRLTAKNDRPYINWNPSDDGFGKNPAGLPAEFVPNINTVPDYLEKCLRTTIDAISQANVESNAEEERLRELRQHFETTLKAPAEFTKLARNMRDTNAATPDKQILIAVAKERGYELDKSDLSFSDPNAAKEAAAAETTAAPAEAGKAQTEAPF